MSTTLRKDNNMVITMGGDGEIFLRHPTAIELNKHSKEAYPTDRKGFRDSTAKTIIERVKFFDLLFVKMVNFVDEPDADGKEAPIAEDAKDRIPADVKSYIISTLVEVKADIDVKN